MISFFRKIRQELFKNSSETSLPNGKTGQYLKYAFGEIILVVIGILIALQINNWQNQDKENQLERRYISNLINDLKNDSAALHSNFLKLKIQATSKDKLYQIFNGNSNESDSLLVHFKRQWFPITPYSPVKSTFDEMISNSHLGLIKPDTLRESILKLYARYDAFAKLEDFQSLFFNNTMDELQKRVPNLLDPSTQDVLAITEDFYIMNKINQNGANYRRDGYQEMLDTCTNSLAELQIYKANLY